MSMVTQFELLNKLVENLHKFNVTATSKLVLVYLCRCWNNKKGYMYPRLSTISKALGISESSVKRAIKELANNSLIIYEAKKEAKFTFTGPFFDMLQIEPKKVQNEQQNQAKMTLCCSRTNNSEQRIKNTKNLIQSYKQLKPSSPLDFSREQAIDYLSKLPKALMFSPMNQKLIKKYNL